MNGEPIKKIFKQIESKVDEGEHLLANFELLKQIEFQLEPDFTVTDKQLTPREFMIELTLALFRSLKAPSHLSCLEGVGALLKPLKEVKDIGCSEAFNHIVKVREKPVIKDTRMSLSEFVKGLCDYLIRDKSAEKKAASQKPPSRRIFGFAPRPDDDQNRK